MWGIIVGIIDWMVGVAVDIATTVWTVLTAVWKVVNPLHMDTFLGLKGFWSDVLGPMLYKGAQLFDDVVGWFKGILKPIADVINTIRGIEKAIYDTFFAPIFETIAMLQSLITLLHLQNTTLGQDLTHALTTVQNIFTTVYNDTIGVVNEVISKIDSYLLDIDGLLRGPLLLTSIWANQASLWRMTFHRWASLPTSGGYQALRELSIAPTVRTSRGYLETYLRGDGGPIAAPIKQSLPVMTSILNGNEPAIWQPHPTGQ